MKYYILRYYELHGQNGGIYHCSIIRIGSILHGILTMNIMITIMVTDVELTRMIIKMVMKILHRVLEYGMFVTLLIS